jgi:hypothetical protein
MTTFNADALKNTQNTDGDNQGAEFEMCERTENLLKGVVAGNKGLVDLLKASHVALSMAGGANALPYADIGKLLARIKSAIEAHDKGMA